MKLLISAILVCLFNQNAIADTMDNAYDKAKLGAAAKNDQGAVIMKSTDPSSLPGYQGSSVPQVNYKSQMGSQESTKALALSDPTVRLVYDSAHDTISTRAQKDSESYNEFEKVAGQSDQYGNSGSYCSSGDCHDGVDQPNNEISYTTAALEDVLGGAQSYSESGNDAKIYTGKPYKCKSGDSLGAVNCCKDKGWAVDLGLSRCSSKEKDLGKKKESGLCQYTGEYSHTTRGPFGVPIRTDYYKGYCCFSSKMAQITHVQGRPQLSMNWGSGKSPNCQGFTPDQFAKLDFSKINLQPIYSDLTPTPVNQKEMLSKPEQYVEQQGIVSW